jgi:hypothetical protein
MAEGFLGGIGDFFTGGGVYSDPKAINPTYGVPEGDVRQAAINQLGQMSALLLAAGQPMEGRDRAQLLSQIGGTGNQFNTNLYNAAQRRLMTAQMAEKQDESLKIQAMSQKIKDDPEGLQKSLASNGVNIPLEVLKTAPTKSLVDLVSQITLKRATIEPSQAAISEAFAKTGGAAPAPAQATGGAAPAAPSALGLTYSSASIPEGTAPQDVATINAYRSALNNPVVARDPEQVKKITDVLDRLLPGAREASIQKAKRQEEIIANKPKAQLQLSSYGDQTKLVTNTIDDAINLINSEGRAVAGTFGSKLTGIYEPATNLEGQLDTILSAVGSGKIQEMKAQSATGATGYGALAIKELERIEANTGSLKQAQGPEELKKRLLIIKDAMNKYNENMMLGYKQQYGEDYKPAEQQQTALAQQPVQAPTGAPARINSQAEYNSLKSGTMFVAPDGSIRRKP